MRYVFISSILVSLLVFTSTYNGCSAENTIQGHYGGASLENDDISTPPNTPNDDENQGDGNNGQEPPTDSNTLAPNTARDLGTFSCDSVQKQVWSGCRGPLVDPSRFEKLSTQSIADVSGQFAVAKDPQTGWTLAFGNNSVVVYDDKDQVLSHEPHSIRGRVTVSHFIYYPPNGHFYIFAENGMVHELRLDRVAIQAKPPEGDGPSYVSLTALKSSGTAPSTHGNGLAYDSANQLIGGPLELGIFYVYDPTTKTWLSKNIQLEEGKQTQISYDYFSIEFVDSFGVYLMVSQEADSSLLHGWIYRW